MRRMLVRLYEWLDPGLFISEGHFDYREWHAYWIGLCWAFCFFMGDPWQCDDAKREPHYCFVGAKHGVILRCLTLALITLAALIAALLIVLAFSSLIGGSATCPR